MDIISHTLTGIAVGTILANISNGSFKKKGLIILTGGLGGALPDFDAISLWSKFDSTIGSWLNLQHSGSNIYFGKFWYSHHAAMHSILAPLVLILLSVLIRAALKQKLKFTDIKQHIFSKRLFHLAFFFGFLLHLFEDMPTPASVWGGVNLFFPSSAYVGGFGNIWWWNNYDLVLIIISVIGINLILNVLPKRLYGFKVKSSLAVFLIGLSCFMYQIKTRPLDFSYSGHSHKYQEFELQSKEIQKEILGERLYNIMTDIDNRIPLNF